MPYRALLWTMVTVGIALLALAMWVRAIDPILVWMRATESVATAPATSAHAAAAGTQAAEDLAKMKSHLRAVLMLEFLLILLLLIVGLAATTREWLRYRGDPMRLARKRRKTAYVDAWKIAGERLKEKQDEA